MVALEGGRFVEATESSETPSEHDEGVYIVEAVEMRNRLEELSAVRVLRSRLAPFERLEGRARHHASHSPAYPSVGAILLGFACAYSRLTRRCEYLRRRRWDRLVYRMACDGTARMQCAEFAVRLFAEVGLVIEIPCPTVHVVADVRQRQPDLLQVQLPPRVANRARRRAALFGASSARRELAATMRIRLDRSVQRDYAGLIVPADLERSRSFDLVVEVARLRRGLEVTVGDSAPTAASAEARFSLREPRAQS